MKISKIRNVKTPSRGYGTEHDRSAGLDFFIPEYDAEFASRLKELNGSSVEVNEFSIWVKGSKHVLIPSGIKVNIRTCKFDFTKYNALMLKAENKSSVSTKYRLDVGATVVDEDYQGEVHISLTNTSTNDCKLQYGQKIAQFIVQPILLETVEVVDECDLFDSVSIRGTNGFGSSTK